MWDAEKIETLKRFWPQTGVSALAIGGMIGKSKNAVIGKARRLHLALRDKAEGRTLTNIRRRSGQKVKLAVRPLRVPCDAAPVLKAEFFVAPVSNEVGTIPFADATEKHCMWIPGDVRQDSRVCGKPRVPDSPWCAEHKRRAYQPPEPRRPAPMAPKPISVPSAAPVPALEQEAAA